jgi:hypothetical protein
VVGFLDAAQACWQHVEADVVLRALAGLQAAAPGALDPGALVPAVDQHVGHGPAFLHHGAARALDLQQAACAGWRPGTFMVAPGWAGGAVSAHNAAIVPF